MVKFDPLYGAVGFVAQSTEKASVTATKVQNAIPPANLIHDQAVGQCGGGIVAKCRRRLPTLRSETSDARGLTELNLNSSGFDTTKATMPRLWGNRIGTGRTGWSWGTIRSMSTGIQQVSQADR